MKIINEKGKLFGIINIIDLCIILLVAMVSAVVVMFFSANTTIDTKSQKTQIKIEARVVEKDICDAVIADKKVFDVVQNKSLGKLVDFDVKSSVEYNFSKETGEHIESEIPNRYDLTLTIDAESSEDLYVGKFMSVETKDFRVGGYIIDIEKRG